MHITNGALVGGTDTQGERHLSPMQLNLDHRVDVHRIKEDEPIAPVAIGSVDGDWSALCDGTFYRRAQFEWR